MFFFTRVIAFTCSSSLGYDLSNIKVQFLSKKTTSKLQMLEAGIFNSFKSKLRKKLARNVVYRKDTGKRASDIVKEVDVRRAVQWI